MQGGEEVPDFEEIYRAYFVDVYRYILALSRDAQTAEEVTQGTFVRALTAIDGFRGECQIRVWLCQIARNQYLSLCRERRKFAEEPGETGDRGIEEGFADRETARQLHVLLHALPEPYKEVFSLRTFGELPFAQIGELFGKTESWARVTYFRARQKLKEALET
jgi:RNA polymerase sigma factor, sigma-70 family